jgi:hypothetical protein
MGKYLPELYTIKIYPEIIDFIKNFFGKLIFMNAVLDTSDQKTHTLRCLHEYFIENFYKDNPGVVLIEALDALFNSLRSIYKELCIRVKDTFFRTNGMRKP